MFMIYGKRLIASSFSNGNLNWFFGFWGGKNLVSAESKQVRLTLKDLKEPYREYFG
jgi:hypothetical protein